MIHKYKTLINRLNDIVDEVHIDEVKQIITSLTKINNFKNFIGENLCTSTIYEKISFELKNEFNIESFKILLIEDSIEKVLFKNGDNINLDYKFSSKVSNNTEVVIIIEDKVLTSYQKLLLNSYFSELIHLLYIQFVLQDLKKTANIDPLTKLENRISFNHEMKILIPLALRENMKIGVLLVNIDRFRAVNDEHGDEFGDEFLKLYAKTIKETIRTSDIAVRFGGGEFLILLVNIDTDDRAMELANNLKDKLAQTYLKSPNGDEFKKTVCIGISMFPEDSIDINEIVKNSEMALSDARDNSRNNVLRYQKNDDGEIDLF
ncbi:MAG: GGDEF domain-containing protein [Campylobacterota bacterium]|nr:GGDEF domain-containing protein [Campylobacterota bacterium]